jgi:hypothetical protein
MPIEQYDEGSQRHDIPETSELVEDLAALEQAAKNDWGPKSADAFTNQR